MSETKKIKKIIFIPALLFLVILTLSGCTSMNSSFDCPNKPGVTCRSLDQVNDMVDRGIIGRDISIENSRASNFYPAKNSLNMVSTSNPSYSLRSGEQVARVWIAPYQDVHSNYHNESIIYTVVRKNNWAVPIEVKE